MQTACTLRMHGVQGNYSHSLAEYTLAACNWFAKDLPRLRAQQKARRWEPYDVEELRCTRGPAPCTPRHARCGHAPPLFPDAAAMRLRDTAVHAPVTCSVWQFETVGAHGMHHPKPQDGGCPVWKCPLRTFQLSGRS